MGMDCVCRRCSAHEFELTRWYRCNEVGFFQDGAPSYWPTLVTRLVQPSSDEVCHAICDRLSRSIAQRTLLAAMHLLLPRAVPQRPSGTRRWRYELSL